MSKIVNSAYFGNLYLFLVTPHDMWIGFTFFLNGRVVPYVAVYVFFLLVVCIT